MHQKRRIRNFEDISKCLLRNSKLSSPYIYPQLLDQIVEDNPNENTSKAGVTADLDPPGPYPLADLDPPSRIWTPPPPN